jgi:hypothetical protein
MGSGREIDANPIGRGESSGVVEVEALMPFSIEPEGEVAGG